MATLARLLKYKNRVIERMRKLERDIQVGNSVLSGGERDIDIRWAIEERLLLENHLIELKLALDKANEPIKSAILCMQELKARITFYQSISTNHGMQTPAGFGYGEQGILEYDAIIRKNELDAWILDVNDKIDAIQEKIDQFNNTNKIDWTILTFRN